MLISDHDWQQHEQEVSTLSIQTSLLPTITPSYTANYHMSDEPVSDIPVYLKAKPRKQIVQQAVLDTEDEDEIDFDQP